MEKKEGAEHLLGYYICTTSNIKMAGVQKFLSYGFSGYTIRTAGKRHVKFWLTTHKKHPPASCAEFKTEFLQ